MSKSTEELIEQFCLLVQDDDAPELFVLTGGPNSGKTTIAMRLKSLGFYVIDEVATMLIEKHGQSVKQDVMNFQEDVFQAQLASEIVARKLSGKVVGDRGLIEQVGYFRAHGIPLPEKDLVRLKTIAAATRRPLYKKVFVFETIEKWDDNGVRDENIKLSKRIADELCIGYAEFGMAVVRVPVFADDRELSISKRVEFVLHHMEQT